MVAAKNASACAMRSTGVCLHFGLAVVVFGQAVNLLDIEDGVALHVMNLALGLLALVVLLGPGDGIRIDDERAFLALADMRLQLRMPA